MKKIIGILLASSALATGALANGNVPAPAQDCVQRVPDWGGFKIGAQLGYGHSTNDSTLTTHQRGAAAGAITRLSGDIASDGVLGGVHGGWDYQWNRNWIVGLEAFFDFSGMDGDVTAFDNVNGALGSISSKSTEEMNWSVGIAARLGYVMNDSLFYGGIGWVGSEWDVKTSLLDRTGAGAAINASGSKEKFLNGLRLSAGAAQRFGRWLLGVEGGYTWYESETHNFAYANGANTIDVSHKIEPRVLDVKLKLSYML